MSNSKLFEQLLQELVNEELSNFFINKAKSEFDDFVYKPRNNKLLKHYKWSKPFFNKKFYDLADQEGNGSLYKWFFQKPKQQRLVPGQTKLSLNKQETSLINVLKNASSSNPVAKKILTKQKVSKAELYNLSKWLIQNGLVQNKSIQDLNLSLGGIIYHILNP